MKSKIILNTLVLMLVATVSFGQTVGQKVTDIKKNPVTEKAAAQADSRLIDMKIVADRKALDPTLSKRKDLRYSHGRKRKLRRH